MKRQFSAVLVLLLFVLSRNAYSQNSYYLSQVANGNYGDGSFRTTFILFNNTNSNATVQLKLTDNSGNSLTVTIPGLGTDSEFAFNVDAGSSRILQTDGSGNLVSGAATVISATSIGVSSIFTIYDNAGNFVTESGVGNSQPSTEFVMPVGVIGQSDTGLALFNPNGSKASITFILQSAAGVEAGRTTASLDSNAHMASFVSQLFPTAKNFNGTLIVQSSVPIAALTLRQNSAPLSYTSLPVVPRSTAQTSMSLAHVANGSFSDGSFRTSFLIFNPSATRTASVVLNITKDDGSPFPMTLGTQGTKSTFNLSLPPGASILLQSDGSGTLTSGAATITSDAPVGASAVFTVFNPQGQYKTEAGVGDSPVLTNLTLPVDITGNFDTGVAFFNPGNSSITLTFRLMDASGANIGSSTTIQLAAKSHTARFVSQLFPVSNFRGTLAISSSGGVAALTLRQNSAPLSYTTLPVASGSSQGKTQVAPLLSQTQTGTDATSNQTVNQTLPAGFRLSGKIIGSGTPAFIVAQSGSTSIFIGRVDIPTGNYVIVVPAGTYTLIVVYAPSTSGQGVTLAFADPNAVQVSADTKRDVTLPSANLFKVSGTVSGTSSIPASQSAPNVVFTSNDGTAEGIFAIGSNGSYQGSIPAGTYTVSVSVSGIQFSPLQSQSLSLYNIGSLTVSGDTSGNFSVPATSKLSGKVQATGLPLLAGASVVASDTSGPTATQVLFLYAPTASSATPDITSGQYQMLLTRNRNYSVGVWVPYLQGSTFIGVVSYSISANPISLGGDATLDFNLPAFPVQVTISGRVTDGSGNGVNNVTVTAVTQSLSGAANMSFSAGAKTDASGNYRLTVLSGTNYQLVFTPPSLAP